MKHLLLFTLIIFESLLSIGQTKDVITQTLIFKDTNDVPLIVVNDKMIIKNYNRFVYSDKSVDDFVILRSEEAVNRFGEKGKAGAILIKLKAGTKLFNINDLINHYKIEQKESNLPVCLNDYYVSDPHNLIVDASLISSVVVREGTFLAGANEQSDHQRFLDIQTIRN
jgi:hypothetical protein